MRAMKSACGLLKFSNSPDELLIVLIIFISTSSIIPHHQLIILDVEMKIINKIGNISL